MKIKKTGFSLLEIMVTMSIMFLIIPLLMNLIYDIQKNSSSTIASALQRGKDSAGIAKIGRTINSSAKFIARDYGEAAPTTVTTPTSISQFYLNAIKLPTTFTKMSKIYTPLDITSRVLPVYDPSGTFSPENVDVTQFPHPFTNSNVGNTLMCITVEDYLTYPYNSSGDYNPTSPSPLKRRFPLYQIHYFFLAKASGSEFQKRVSTVSSVDKKKLSLFEWKSQYFFDYNDLNNFVTCGSCSFGGSFFINTSNSSVLDSLKANVNIIVKPDLINTIPVAGILKQSESDYTVNKPIGFPLSSGSISASKLTGTEYINTNPIPMLSIDNVILYPDSKSDIAYGIATNNFTSASTYNASDANRVPFFKGTQSLYTAADGFPHGFEVMLSGTTGSTKAFIKMMTLASGYGTYSYNTTMTTFQGKN